MQNPEQHDGGVKPLQELNTDEKRQIRVNRILELVKKITETGENIPFPGIHPRAYLRMKATDDKYPGYTTPTDTIIERCEKEGIKVVLGNHPRSGNVFVLPAGSDNIEDDSFAPHQLNIDNVKNNSLIELIVLTSFYYGRGLYEYLRRL